MIYDVKFTRAADLPWVRIFRPKDRRWLNPKTGKFQAEAPESGISYERISIPLDSDWDADAAGDFAPAYPGMAYLFIPTPVEFWGINVDVVIICHEYPDPRSDPTSVMMCKVNVYVKSDISGYHYITIYEGNKFGGPLAVIHRGYVHLDPQRPSQVPES